MQTFTLEKFTTQCTVSLFEEVDSSDVHKLAQEVERIIDDFEGEFSRFLPTSILSQLNTGDSLSLSPRFLELIKLTQDAITRTHGAFHPCISVAKRGYGVSFDTKFQATSLSESPITHSLLLSDYLLYEPMTDTYHLFPGYTLDLGGIAKGFLVDLLSKQIQEAGYYNFLVNFGGDILVSGIKEDKTPYYIEIDDGKGGEMGIIDLSTGSISTSGSYKRTRHIHDTNYHHIITPSTGTNNRDLISASVIGSDTVTTDSFATAVMTGDADAGIQLLEQNHLDGVLIDTQGILHMTEHFQEKYHLGKE